MDYKAIVLAAGQGKRMNAGFNKQLIKLNGTPLIIHSLRLFEADDECSEIILVVSANEREDMNKLVEDYKLKKVRKLVIGGVERQDSVYAGLSAINDKGIVLIHDGARPFVKRAVIQGLVDEAEKAGGAIAAVPVKDTIKRTAGGFIEKTVERADLWAAQTPQGFQYDLILEAHRDAKAHGYTGTDDASLVERIGKPVSIVESDYLNLKLTTEEDLLFAETILQAKENER
ncbi:2-C-methyl-D-erythritol 4-phosphate cytidylyltransferase [Bacillus sp. JCM 19041]|uniref:2-C-methyl-D-erythritol 4-phosphate cytidylyltransferase n=1 Tax=Bacillus sp. JCM 19041 TaxID=1460637 RepID=UPI0006CFCBDD